MATNRRAWRMAASAMLLGAGGALYVLFRPRTLLLFAVLHELGLMPVVDAARRAVAGVAVPEFVVYALPGGLWSAAFVVLMAGLFANAGRGRRAAWAAVVPLMGVTSELMQWAGWLPGRADWCDVLCYAVPWLLLAIPLKR